MLSGCSRELKLSLLRYCHTKVSCPRHLTQPFLRSIYYSGLGLHCLPRPIGLSHYLSHVMRKSVYAICMYNISTYYSVNFKTLAWVSVAEQAGLSLTWSETLKTGFLVTCLERDTCGNLLVISPFQWPFLTRTASIQKKFSTFFFPFFMRYFLFQIMTSKWDREKIELFQ